MHADICVTVLLQADHIEGIVWENLAMWHISCELYIWQQNGVLKREFS